MPCTTNNLSIKVYQCIKEKMSDWILENSVHGNEWLIFMWDNGSWGLGFTFESQESSDS